MLASLLAALTLASAPTDTVRLVLVATTDVHGHATAWDYLQNAPWPGGLSRAATVIDSLRDRYPGQVVLVDAGDALQGDAFAAYFGRVAPQDPHPIIDVMNLLGYDAATPGDHDFDFGLPTFNRFIAGSTFPWVSANLRVLPEDTLMVAPYVVVQRNGARIAIAGFLTAGASVTQRDHFRGLARVEPMDGLVGPMLREMRKDADLTVLLVHSGMSGRASYDTSGVGDEHVAGGLATGATRPDLVVVGHSHESLADAEIGGVHFVQPEAEGRGLAVVHITLVTRDDRLVPVRIHAEAVSLADVPSSPRVQRRIAEAQATVVGWASKGIAEASRRMSLAGARVEDTPLLRLVNQAQRRASGAQLSAASAPDLRAGLEAGEITLGEVFRLVPNEYTLRAVKISGADLHDYLELAARYFFVDSSGKVAPNKFQPGANFDVVAGASYTLDLDQPAGARITRLEVRGRPVAPTDSFTLALSSYRQQGGGNFPMLARAPVVYDKGQSIRDLVQAEIERRHLLRPEDFTGSDWQLAPNERGRRARALFLRDEAPAAAPVAEGPPPRVLPVTPSRAELQARDSLQRERDRQEALASATLATLRLPALRGGALPRLLADAYRNFLRSDVAVVARSEPAADLPSGPLTRALIEAAAPADAGLLTVKLTGAELLSLLENILGTDPRCCELSGLTVEFDPKAPRWNRVRRTRFIGGASLEKKRSYTVALSARLLEHDVEFPLAASDCRPDQGCQVPGELRRWTVIRSEQSPADALRDYLRRLPQPVTPPEDQRLQPRK